mmetsp:Transcript_10569/g.36517  ORF Transcript_10569/g.36517 Transcript_10569/m.36517 type:complete len:211 (-) Transcript_10569:141-773(-)
MSSTPHSSRHLRCFRYISAALSTLKFLALRNRKSFFSSARCSWRTPSTSESSSWNSSRYKRSSSAVRPQSFRGWPSAVSPRRASMLVASLRLGRPLRLALLFKVDTDRESLGLLFSSSASKTASARDIVIEAWAGSRWLARFFPLDGFRLPPPMDDLSDPTPPLTEPKSFRALDATPLPLPPPLPSSVTTPLPAARPGVAGDSGPSSASA